MGKKISYGLLAIAAVLGFFGLGLVGIFFLATAGYLHYLEKRTISYETDAQETDLASILFRFVFTIAGSAFMQPYASESLAAFLIPSALMLPLVLEGSVKNLIHFALPNHMVANLKAPIPSLPSLLAKAMLPLSMAVVLVAAILPSVGLTFQQFSYGAVALALISWAPDAFFVLGRNWMQSLRPRVFSMVLSKLNARGAVHAFYFDGPADAVHHVTMWTKQMESLKDPYFVIVRSRVSVHLLKEKVKAPIIWARSIEELDELVDKISTLKIVFYANNGAKNTHMVRFHNLTHVQLLHGESDKPPSYNPITAMYDKVFVAGQGAIDRYKRHGVKISESKFEIISRPQLAELKTQDEKAPAEFKTVLYAPTWGGHFGDTDFTSLYQGQEIVNALLEKDVRVIFRPHPYSRNNPSERDEIDKIDKLLAAASTENRKHVFGNKATNIMTINDCINESDAMVCDISSVVGDYLFTKKPFAVMTGTDDFASFEAVNPLSSLGYLVNGDLRNIHDVLNDMLGSDNMQQKRDGGRSYFLSDKRGEELTGLFTTAVEKILQKAEISKS